jgi:ABC-type multidrug transport system fused ATPase/permease subunit
MLLARMYDPSCGKIFINDMDISSIDGSKIREKYISIVPQETALFNDSVLANVWYPHNKQKEVSDDIKDSARLSFVADWSATVGERGQNLSGGERQRIAIARALAKQKPLLLLDEATSALDQESDSIILSRLSKIPQTVLAVTHRMSAIEWSDRLTVVANGRVVQEGDTVDLLRNPGTQLHRLLAQIEKSEPS